MFLNIRGAQEEPSVLAGFLRGSLFDTEAADASELELPELVFDAEEFLRNHNEEHALHRYGALFFDYLYTMDIDPAKDAEEGEEDESVGLEVVCKIRLVTEESWKRILIGPVQLQMSPSLLHRLEFISKLAFDDILPRAGNRTCSVVLLYILSRW